MTQYLLHLRYQMQVMYQSSRSLVVGHVPEIQWPEASHLT
jgi:hypothetical protein